MKSIPWT